MSDIQWFRYYLSHARQILANFPSHEMIPPLYSFQIATANRLNRLLQIVRIILNITPMGGGKTFYTIFSAWTFGLSLIVIGLGTIEEKWRDVAKAFGVPMLAYYNYTGINGKHGKNGSTTQPKCLLIRRVAVPNQNNDGSGDYYQPTELLQALVEQGVMIVFDEASKLKNETKTFLAAWTICQYVKNVRQTRTRVVLLSASPADRSSNVSQLLGLMGINDRPQLYIYDKSRPVHERVILTGLPSVQNWARRQNNELERQIALRYSIDYNPPVSNIREYAFEVWTKIVTQRLLLGGPPPELSASIWNVYCNLEPQYRPALEKALAMMKDAITIDEFGNTRVIMEILTQSLIETSRAKRPLVVQLARTWLEMVPNSKVIIGDMFIESLHYYSQALHYYQPLEYSGEAGVKPYREQNRRRFVNVRDPCRVLNTTIQSGQMGIDMDAKEKGMNILLILLPTYHFLTMYQMSGRVTRADTKSMPTIIVPYVYDNPNRPSDSAMEQNLLRSIAEKTENTKAILGQETHCLPFPGEYPSFVMPDPNQIRTLPARKVWQMVHNPADLELALQHYPPYEFVEAGVVHPMRNRDLTEEDMTRLGLLVKYGYTNSIRLHCTELVPAVRHLLTFTLEGLCWTVVKYYSLDTTWTLIPRLLRDYFMREYGDRCRFTYHRG